MTSKKENGNGHDKIDKQLHRLLGRIRRIKDELATSENQFQTRIQDTIVFLIESYKSLLKDQDFKEIQQRAKNCVEFMEGFLYLYMKAEKKVFPDHWLRITSYFANSIELLLPDFNKPSPSEEDTDVMALWERTYEVVAYLRGIQILYEHQSLKNVNKGGE